jgi:hypothetical protein
VTPVSVQETTVEPKMADTGIAVARVGNPTAIGDGHVETPDTAENAKAESEKEKREGRPNAKEYTDEAWRRVDIRVTGGTKSDNEHADRRP